MKSSVFITLLVLAVSTGLPQDYEYEEIQETDVRPRVVRPGEFICPRENGFFPHLTKCDAYWHCKNDIPEYKVCGNGLAFDDFDHTRENCNYLHLVDCGERTDLDPAISAENCPYLYGVFSDPTDCSVFYSCWNGEATRYSCAPGLAYDPDARVCTWMDKVPECQKQRALKHQDFQCPAPGELAASGSFSRHAHPDDCRQYYVCFDGIPREYGCPIGTAFKIGVTEGIGECADPAEVPGCEDYYGDLDPVLLRRGILSGQLLLSGKKQQQEKPRNLPAVAPQTQDAGPDYEQ